MSISYVTSNKVRHVGDGTTTVFNFSFKLLSSSHLKVYPITRSTNTRGTLWIEGVDYTVAISTTAEGGSITAAVAPASTVDLLLINDLPDDSELDLATVSTFPSKTLDTAFDRLHLLVVKLHEKVKRSLKNPINTTLAEFDLPEPAAGKALKWNDAATALVNSDTQVDEIVEEAEAARDAAVAAQTDAEAAQAAAEAAQANAETAETNAETAEQNAETAQALAEAARDAAQAAVNSVGWRDVVFITNADSPYTLDETHRAKMICADCSGGAITVNLPEIAGLDLSSAYMVGIKKTDGSGNAVTVVRASTDTIDGGTTKTLAVAEGGATFIPDTDPSPDEWTSAEFGAQAGNLSVDSFSGDGSETDFTLAVDPGTKNNTWVFVEGIYQQKDTYSVSGTTLTFTEAPPSGTNNVQVISGSTLSIGTPSNDTITAEKMATSGLNAVLAVSKLKNLICNGEFRFWQRQTPATLTSRQDDAYSADRWYLLNSGGAVNIQGARVAEVIASSPTPYVAQFRNADATARQFGPAQIIEYDKAVALRGKTVTMSFWARTDGTEVPNIRAGLIEWTGTADSVTSDIVSSWGATPTLIANAAFANTPADLALTGTMQQFSITVTLGTTFNNLIPFVWTPAAEAQNDDFYLTQVQLVEWSEALPWNVIRQAYSDDLRECQRFFEKSYNVDVAPGTVTPNGNKIIMNSNTASSFNVFLMTAFKVAKRGTPTVTTYNPATGGSGTARDSGAANRTAVAGHIGEADCYIDIQSLPATANGSVHYTADAEL